MRQRNDYFKGKIHSDVTKLQMSRTKNPNIPDCSRLNWKTRYLWNEYEMLPNEYEKMLLDQDFTCLICGCILEPDNISVDHDHLTGEVRGLLCRQCNTGLGKFEKRPEKFIAYLERV